MNMLMSRPCLGDGLGEGGGEVAMATRFYVADFHAIDTFRSTEENKNRSDFHLGRSIPVFVEVVAVGSGCYCCFCFHLFFMKKTNKQTKQPISITHTALPFESLSTGPDRVFVLFCFVLLLPSLRGTEGATCSTWLPTPVSVQRRKKKKKKRKNKQTNKPKNKRTSPVDPGAFTRNRKGLGTKKKKKKKKKEIGMKAPPSRRTCCEIKSIVEKKKRREGAGGRRNKIY